MYKSYFKQLSNILIDILISGEEKKVVIYGQRIQLLVKILAWEFVLICETLLGSNNLLKLSCTCKSLRIAVRLANNV